MKKSLFKAVALLLAALLLFTGCSGKGKSSTDQFEKLLNPKEPVSIEIWHYYNGPQKQAFDKAVEEFNNGVGKEKGIIVEAFSQGNISELTEKVLDAANKKVGADDVPDVFAAYADTAYAVDQLGLAAELDQYLTKEELDEYVSDYMEEGRFDAKGSLKIFPIAKSTELFMLNKTDWDKFAAATGAKTEDLATMEGLTKVAKAYYEWTDSLTDTPNDGKAFFGRDAMANYFIVGCKQLGKEIFSVTDGQVTYQVDEATMRKLWDNFYVPYVSGYFGAYGKFRSDDAKTGDIIALVGSTSGALYFPNKVIVGDTESYPIDTMVLPLPVFEGGEKVNVQQGAGMVVSKSTPQKEYAATIFLKWFTDVDRNIEFSAGSGYMPVKKAANDMTKINAVLSTLTQTEMTTKNLLESMPVAIEMTKSYQFYTSKAFENGTKTRAVLENSLFDRAKADRAGVEELLKSGMSYEAAVAKYNTDENFAAWLAAFQKELNDCKAK